MSHGKESFGWEICKGCARAGRAGRRGAQGWERRARLLLYFISVFLSLLSPSVSTTAQAAALTTQTNEQKERSLLPSDRFCLKCEQEKKSLLSLQRSVSLQLMLNSTESR